MMSADTIQALLSFDPEKHPDSINLWFPLKSNLPCHRKNRPMDSTIDRLQTLNVGV